MASPSLLTNEEQRVRVYADDVPPTHPSIVNHDTPLKSLNLNWREADLPERERTKHIHRLHPYLGKYIPQLVEIFLRKYFSPGQVVLDPFMGSGTTLVQANELGIDAIGYDISAFNVLLCEAKTARYDLPAAQREVLDILERVRVETQATLEQPTLWTVESSPESNLPSTDCAYLNEWFAPQALRELLTYRKHIESGSYRYKTLLKVILSRSARSARQTTHFDLDFPKKPQQEPYFCYKHSRICSPTTEAFKFLERYSLDTLKRVKEFSKLRTEARVSIHHADSRTASIPPIHGIITSPPYCGLIDYHVQHSYAYHLLGLEDRRQSEIGAAANGTSQKAKRAYQEAIAQVFCNAADSMPPGSYMIVVAGDRADLYPEIAEMIGVEVEAVVRRHVNRRTGRRAGEFYESVFIWRKR
jgi:hypothetical protein